MMCKVCKREDVINARGKVEEHTAEGKQCPGSGKYPAATPAEKARYVPLHEIGL